MLNGPVAGETTFARNGAEFNRPIASRLISLLGIVAVPPQALQPFVLQQVFWNSRVSLFGVRCHDLLRVCAEAIRVPRPLALQQSRESLASRHVYTVDCYVDNQVSFLEIS